MKMNVQTVAGGRLMSHHVRWCIQTASGAWLTLLLLSWASESTLPVLLAGLVMSTLLFGWVVAIDARLEAVVPPIVYQLTWPSPFDYIWDRFPNDRAARLIRLIWASCVCSLQLCVFLAGALALASSWTSAGFLSKSSKVRVADVTRFLICPFSALKTSAAILLALYFGWALLVFDTTTAILRAADIRKVIARIRLQQVKDFVKTNRNSLAWVILTHLPYHLPVPTLFGAKVAEPAVKQWLQWAIDFFTTS